jgi:hypothetical protein
MFSKVPTLSLTLPRGGGLRRACTRTVVYELDHMHLGTLINMDK